MMEEEEEVDQEDFRTDRAVRITSKWIVLVYTVFTYFHFV